jgi:hypothetical protein
MFGYGKVQIYLIIFDLKTSNMETLSLSADSSSLSPTGTSLPAPRISRLSRHGSRHLEVNFGENLHV